MTTLYARCAEELLKKSTFQTCKKFLSTTINYSAIRRKRFNASVDNNQNNIRLLSLSMKQFSSQAFDQEIPVTNYPKLTTPKKDGYIFPAEWSSHKQCFIGWPDVASKWREGGIPAQRAIAEIAKAISQFEPVTVVASNPTGWKAARSRLPQSIRVIQIPNNDCWLRDSGPIFVKSTNHEVEELARGVVFNFTAWGGPTEPAYGDWSLDSQFAENLLQVENVSQYYAGMVLEGGSISVDGQGTLVTTEECLLNPNRNPSMSKEEIEHRLQEFLGIKKVIWLPYGVYGDDDTNGHVDNMCQFTQPGTVVLHWTDDPKDPQYERSHEAYERLNSTTDAKGRKIKVFKLHLPGPLYRTVEEQFLFDGCKLRPAGQRLPASYVNFYVTNGGVVAPKFNHPNDELAKKTLEEAFPGRRIVQVYAREVLLGGGCLGCIHCMTQTTATIRAFI
ncbi:Agmatine deiminase [Galdieria sulphuraria]|nr:Agmatine deiminase [Galdieria sulphuraria]